MRDRPSPNAKSTNLPFPLWLPARSSFLSEDNYRTAVSVRSWARWRGDRPARWVKSGLKTGSCPTTPTIAIHDANRLRPNGGRRGKCILPRRKRRENGVGNANDHEVRREGLSRIRPAAPGQCRTVGAQPRIPATQRAVPRLQRTHENHFGVR